MTLTDDESKYVRASNNQMRSLCGLFGPILFLSVPDEQKM